MVFFVLSPIGPFMYKAIYWGALFSPPRFEDTAGTNIIRPVGVRNWNSLPVDWRNSTVLLQLLRPFLNRRQLRRILGSRSRVGRGDRREFN